MFSNQTIISQTETWIQHFIVQYNICPFAGKEVRQQSIHYEVVRSEDVETCLTSFLSLCKLLDKQKSIETAFLIFPENFLHFLSYLDLLYLAESLLNDNDYEGIYQIASFHPDYCFADSSTDDPANFTNRSPYPMFHILREESVEKAIENHPDTSAIPDRNIAYMREMGIEKLEQLLNKIKTKS